MRHIRKQYKFDLPLYYSDFLKHKNSHDRLWVDYVIFKMSIIWWKPPFLNDFFLTPSPNNRHVFFLDADNMIQKGAVELLLLIRRDAFHILNPRFKFRSEHLFLLEFY